MINKFKIDGVIQGIGRNNLPLNLYEKGSTCLVIFKIKHNKSLLLDCVAFNDQAKEIVKLNTPNPVLLEGQYQVQKNPKTGQYNGQLLIKKVVDLKGDTKTEVDTKQEEELPW